MKTSVRIPRPVRLAPAALLAAAAILAARPASASCGSASCFLVMQEGVGTPREFRFDLTFQYIDQDRGLRGTDHVGEVLTPHVDFEEGEIEPDAHLQLSTRTLEFELAGEYALNRRFAMIGRLPLWIDRDHERIDEPGTPEEAFDGDAGERGVGDLQVGARYAFLVRPRDLLFGDLNVELPTGPWKLHDNEGHINDPGLQPGSGTLDLVAALQYARSFYGSGDSASDESAMPGPRRELFVAGSFRRNGESDLDYRMGDDGGLSVGWRQRAAGRMTWSVQVNARRLGRDGFHGEEVPATGSRTVNLTPGLRVESDDGSLALSAHVQLPVYQKVNESQLAPRWALILGLSRRF